MRANWDKGTVWFCIDEEKLSDKRAIGAISGIRQMSNAEVSVRLLASFQSRE